MSRMAAMMALIASFVLPSSFLAVVSNLLIRKCRNA